MNEQDSEKDNVRIPDFKQRTKGLLPEVGGSVGGALVGLAIGGPGGAIAGAATAPAVVTLMNIVKDALQRRTERAQQVLVEAADLCDLSIVELESLLTESDERLAFSVSVLTAAADTPLSEKIAAFTRLLALGAQAEREQLVNEYLLITHALTAMEAPHLQVLVAVSSSQEDRDEPMLGLTPDDLAGELKVLPESLRPLVRLLELYGLITDVGHRKPETQNSIRWQITDLGFLCLKLLQSNQGKADDSN